MVCILLRHLFKTNNSSHVLHMLGTPSLLFIDIEGMYRQSLPHFMYVEDITLELIIYDIFASEEEK